MKNFLLVLLLALTGNFAHADYRCVVTLLRNDAKASVLKKVQAPVQSVVLTLGPVEMVGGSLGDLATFPNGNTLSLGGQMSSWAGKEFANIKVYIIDKNDFNHWTEVGSMSVQGNGVGSVELKYHEVVAACQVIPGTYTLPR